MSYTHLTADERFSIAPMPMAKFSMCAMGQRINRSPSSISREVRRNKGDCSPYWLTMKCCTYDVNSRSFKMNLSHETQINEC